MTQLDEIEAEFRASGSDEADAEWKQDWGELLIRAVRQFGNAAITARDIYIPHQRGLDDEGEAGVRVAMDRIEPDVMELLKDG